ncbi:nucleic acid binding protein [Malassezia pachydermatis]
MWTRSLTYQYDAAGRPTGQVTAWFRNEADAQKVQQQLHGMTFHDQVLDVSVSLEPTTNSSLAARLAPLPSEARPKKPRRTKKSAPTSRPALSAADLDAELDAFMNTSSMTTEL